MKRSSAFVALNLAFLVSAVLASAQEVISKYEVGAQSALLRQNDFGYKSVTLGVGSRFTYNLSPTFALDSEITFYPERKVASIQQGGREFTAGFGLKAGLRRRKFGVFAKGAPGIVSFSQVGELDRLVTRRRTSFSLDLGGVLEVYPSARTVLRFDVSERVGLFRHRTFEAAPGVLFVAPGSVRPTLQISSGISFRAGRTMPRESEGPGEASKLELGTQFVTLHLARSLTDELHAQVGVGGRATYNLKPYFAIETEVNYFPSDPRVVDFQEGGRALEALVGVKAGLRKRRLGAFLKVRPGILSFGQTLADFSKDPEFPYTRLTHFALDVGGVVEVYTSKRTFLRFDFGDTLLVIRPRQILLTGGNSFIAPGYNKDTVQLGTGFGFRF